MEYRIREAREKLGLTQAQVAKLMGTTQQTTQRYEAGKVDIASNKLTRLAKVLDTTVDYLLGTSPLPTNAIRAIPGGTPRPVIGRISAGDFGTVYEETGESLNVDDDVYVEHKHGFWMKVRGNSMNRLFAEGTMVYIDPNDEVRNGDVGVACVNGDEGTVKRIFFEPNGSVRLHPESYDPEYRDRIVDKSDPDSPSFQIEGKVVAYRSPLCWRA